MQKILLASIVLSFSACVLPDKNDRKVDDEGVANFSKDTLARHIIMLAAARFRQAKP
jgi:hypothetical protein